MVSIIGLGFVGSAMYKSFELKGVKNLYGYDKYKNGGIGSFDECLNSKICFLALPTPFSYEKSEYDKTAIESVCKDLEKNNYNGLVVLKSTVEPETTGKLSLEYNLKIVHNPEFLTARTAFDDFHTQDHIVLGKGKNCSYDNLHILKKFYKKYYPLAVISLCNSIESESMKSFVNCFYSVKIQFFNELYLLCQKNNSDYNKVKELMLKNGWINHMHTNVPGPDGKLSYGGLCFPKDTNALLKYMTEKDTPSQVLNAVINERNEMREDHDNCFLKKY
jgi:UDPglucose 6-dehydrogenase